MQFSHIILVGGFNPSEKYWSKWESPPNRGENKKYLKPPTSIMIIYIDRMILIHIPCIHKRISTTIWKTSKRLQQQRLQMGHAQYWHAALWGTQQLLALGTSEDAKTMENSSMSQWVGNSKQTNMTMEKNNHEWRWISYWKSSSVCFFFWFSSPRHASFQGWL